MFRTDPFIWKSMMRRSPVDARVGLLRSLHGADGRSFIVTMCFKQIREPIWISWWVVVARRWREIPTKSTTLFVRFGCRSTQPGFASSCNNVSSRKYCPQISIPSEGVSAHPSTVDEQNVSMSLAGAAGTLRRLRHLCERSSREIIPDTIACPEIFSSDDICES